jgi:L-asparaginase II
MRGPIEESAHRGHVVQVDGNGAVIRVLGDAEAVVALRSVAKPFLLLALLEAGGAREFGLGPAEIAVMASSHSGEDVHVRTIQGVFRRAGVSQTLLACGSVNAPLDQLTAARLARDGEQPSPVRHNCSGIHAAQLLLARMSGWPLEDYWRPGHPVQVATREVIGRVFSVAPADLTVATDQCGIGTYAFPLAALARAYTLLADPGVIGPTDPRRPLALHLETVRDAMLAHPELVGGSRERLDTALMRALPGRLVVKGGAEGLRAIALVPDALSSEPPSALVIKVEDGDGHARAGWAITVEALRAAGLLDETALRGLARYHRPSMVDPRGEVSAWTVASFDLAPVGELVPPARKARPG